MPAHAAPRIIVPGLSEPARLPPPPALDDAVNATHLIRRLAALGEALDDLPGQARRFARLMAARDAARLPMRYDPSSAHPANIREIDEILAHAHALALRALESPDTS